MFMKRTKELLANWFESSTVLTPEFKKFARTFFKEFKHEINWVATITEFKWNIWHFYVSWFFKLCSWRIFYFSIPDVRWHVDIDLYNILVRTAKDFKDYTWWRNNYVWINNVVESFSRLLSNCKEEWEKWNQFILNL